MAFKSMNDYNDQKYGNFFRLQNDKDYADVIFMYRSTQDVMMVDAHYVKSDTYDGYVACCGPNCPACKKGIRIQPKLFVPVYVLSTSDPSLPSRRIQFWDRTLRFQPQLLNDVFKGYPNPSEFIFRITRHGVARDINTQYEIRAIEENNTISYESIVNSAGVRFPDYYGIICKEVDIFELGSIIESSPTSTQYGQYGDNSYNSGASYTPTPRGQESTPYNLQPPTNAMPTPSVPINAPIPENISENDGVSDLPFGSTDVNSSSDETLDIDNTNVNF